MAAETAAGVRTSRATAGPIGEAGLDRTDTEAKTAARGTESESGIIRVHVPRYRSGGQNCGREGAHTNRPNSLCVSYRRRTSRCPRRNLGSDIDGLVRSGCDGQARAVFALEDAKRSTQRKGDERAIRALNRKIDNICRLLNPGGK